MSVETKSALDKALEDHIRDECDGAILTGYALHASYLNVELDESDSTGYFAEYASHQPSHAAIGLVQMHLKFLLSTVRMDNDDDD